MGEPRAAELTWEEARAETLAQWERIRQIAQSRDVREFAHAVNECAPLCVKARDEAHRRGVGPEERCYLCLRLAPEGVCRHLFADLIVAAIDGQWERVDEEVRRVLDHVRDLRVPPED